MAETMHPSDETLATNVGNALAALKQALEAATAAGLKTYVHADDGAYEECDLTVEVAREYKF